MKQKGNQPNKYQKRRLDILYEDNQILLVNKPARIIVHPNDSEQQDTLLNHVRDYLRRTGKWDIICSVAKKCKSLVFVTSIYSKPEC